MNNAPRLPWKFTMSGLRMTMYRFYPPGATYDEVVADIGAQDWPVGVSLVAVGICTLEEALGLCGPQSAPMLHAAYGAPVYGALV